MNTTLLRLSRASLCALLLSGAGCADHAGGDDLEAMAAAGDAGAGTAGTASDTNAVGGAGGDGGGGSTLLTAGAGSGGVDGVTRMLCDQGCTLTDGLCPNELDIPACDADCEASMANLDNLGCSPQSRDYLSCVVTQPLSAFHCDGLGQSELRLGFCDEVRDDLSDCAILATLNQ